MNSPSTEPSEALVDWVRTNGRSLDDDSALLDAIGGASVLAIGEPGHAAREPLMYRNRVIDLLLERNEIGAVAIESGIFEARTLDDYVRGGFGDGAALVRDHLNWGFGRLSENVALVDRLREHNRARGASEVVRFFGFDIPGGDPHGEVSGAAIATTVVATWLRGLADPRSAILADDLDNLGTQLVRARVRALDERARLGIRLVLDRTDAHLLQYGATSCEEGAWAGVGARITRALFEMLCRWPDVPPGATTLPDDAIVAMLQASGWRDAAMADNVAWLRQLVPGRRVLLFAANGHVIADRHRGGLWVDHPDLGLPAGYHLRARFGVDYRVVLTSSAASLSSRPALDDVGSVDRLLAAAGRDRMLIDLRHSSGNAWLDHVQSIGTNSRYAQAFVPRRASDVLVYFSSLTPHPPAP